MKNAPGFARRDRSVKCPCFQSIGVRLGPHQSPIRIKAWGISDREFFRPWQDHLPQKTVGTTLRPRFRAFTSDRVRYSTVKRLSSGSGNRARHSLGSMINRTAIQRAKPRHIVFGCKAPLSPPNGQSMRIYAKFVIFTPSLTHFRITSRAILVTYT